MTTYLPYLLLTLAVEVPVVALAYRDQWRRMAPTAAGATGATHLAMHFVLPAVAPTARSWFLAGEVLATLGEAGIYAAVARDEGLPKALMVSAVANAASLTAGGLLATWGG